MAPPAAMSPAEGHSGVLMPSEQFPYCFWLRRTRSRNLSVTDKCSDFLPNRLAAWEKQDDDDVPVQVAPNGAVAEDELPYPEPPIGKPKRRNSWVQPGVP